MRTHLMLGALVLGLAATAPVASAWQTYSGSITFSGFATTCTYALTPIAYSYGYVFQNFVGTINSGSASWAWFTVVPTSGWVACTPVSGGFLVSGSISGMAFGGP